MRTKIRNTILACDKGAYVQFFIIGCQKSGDIVPLRSQCCIGVMIKRGYSHPVKQDSEHCGGFQLETPAGLLHLGKQDLDLSAGLSHVRVLYIHIMYEQVWQNKS